MVPEDATDLSQLRLLPLPEGFIAILLEDYAGNEYFFGIHGTKALSLSKSIMECAEGSLVAMSEEEFKSAMGGSFDINN